MSKASNASTTGSKSSSSFSADSAPSPNPPPSSQKTLPRNCRNRLHNGAVFAASVRQLDIAFNSRVAETQAHDIRHSNLANTRRRDRNAQTSTHQTHDRQPLRGLLHHAWSKPMLFTKRDRLLISQRSCRRSKKDKRLITQVPSRNSFVLGKWMPLRKHRNERLREQRLNFKPSVSPPSRKKPASSAPFSSF